VRGESGKLQEREVYPIGSVWTGETCRDGGEGTQKMLKKGKEFRGNVKD